ncbi:galactosylceramide sulfotransferase [Mactra antiquata]
MGSAFYLRRMVMFSVALAMMFLTWNKAIELVDEVYNANTVLNEGLRGKIPLLTNTDPHKSLSGGKDECHHVAYLKVHKTGSSSVQNIFLRFGQTRNLTFILGHDNEELAETPYANMISYSNTLNDKNIVPPPEGSHYDIICCHVIYNRTTFQKYLPTDTKYIGLVRDPITRLESAIRYFQLFSNRNLSEYANDPLRFEKGPHSMSNNRMAFEFGYPLTLFPNSHDQPNDLENAINDYTDDLFDQFDLIMINERMDESLVLMRRILNWQIKDILYMKKLVSKQETRRFSEIDIQNLKPFLYLDFKLYQRSLDVFNTMVDALGQDFQDEVAIFKNYKDQVIKFCKSGKPLELFKGSKWNNEFNVTKEDCRLLNIFETHLIQEIRKRQYGQIGN